MRIGYGVASAALFLSLLVTAAAPGKAESAGTLLQIQPAFAPLAYSGKVYLFNSAGRLEVVPLEGKAASAVSDLPAAPILPPVSTPGGPCFMDGQGRLWNAASAPPSLISSPGPGAVALVPTDGRPAVVYPDRLILPDGRSVALPLRTKGAVQLSDGGYWIYGDHGAARLDAKGAALWTWTSETLRPTTACLAGNSIYSGTQNGIFAALRAKNGKTRWRYPAGGPIEDVVPVEPRRVLFSCSDHYLRCLWTRRGQLAWQVRVPGRVISPLVLCQGGKAFLAAASGARRLSMYSFAGGKMLWTWEAPSGEILLPPVVSDGKAAVVVLTSQNHPLLFRLPLPAPDQSSSGKKAGAGAATGAEAEP
ncbi:MAG: PQQ-binding-like beta-propeller repeat protein [Acidobacteriota bacterium]|jgi:outer membrane protein assembly factor BamB